jgi:aminoglycoside phosphotransferase (APT) family kinase protein
VTISLDTPTTIAARLAEAWPGTTLTADPKALAGGFWATMFRLHVDGQPPDVPADLVFRLAPDASMGAKEIAVQRAVAELGYPTPTIRYAQTGDDAGADAWSIMDFAAGTSPLGDLDGIAALRKAVALFRRLPRQLALPMAALHHLDPATVTAAVTTDAPSVAWNVDTLLGRFATGAAALDRPDLVAIVDGLAAKQPDPLAEVVCHGDLHPFNLLVDATGSTTVLDWTGAILAEPAFDLAYTSMLLATPPLAAPRPFDAIIRRVGTSLSRRFISSYQSLAPDTDLSHLGWYRALHGTRMLIELAAMEATRPEAVAGHPFNALRGSIDQAIAGELPER